MRLQVHSVTKRFRGLTALEDVSLVAGSGISGLIGPNGAGKTTLLSVISGFLKPSSGKVTIDERPITGLKPHKIAELGVARTFQVTRPFLDLTVERNVAAAALLRHGAPKAACELAGAVCMRVGLGDRIKRAASSLGEADRKRLELARALATEPKILLLDEIFAGLNLTEVHALVDVVAQIHADGIGMVLVEHVMQAVMSLCHDVTVLDQGRTIAHGTPQEVVEDPATIQAYLGVHHAS